MNQNEEYICFLTLTWTLNNILFVVQEFVFVTWYTDHVSFE